MYRCIGNTSSFIQTLLLVSDLHRISRSMASLAIRGSRTCKKLLTASREFHPTPKNFSFFLLCYYKHRAIKMQEPYLFFIGNRFFVKTHGQRDSLFGKIHIQYFHIHHIAYADCLQRMFDETICDLADMNKTVLVNADVHKYAKVDDVSDGSF